ncbi:MAG TPA: DUF6184 family natural product biosynthesis lipoprotein [Polyangiaceae bacterium]|jgi:hypothetical protein|nr:DUF6184 family natural product biosynthesis lipoprotein [Polyangiaceae bacterium]
MNGMRMMTVGAFGLLLVGFSGCNRNNEPAPVVDQVPSSPEANMKGAIKDIVTARCDREERCSNVGADKTYATRDACTSKLDGTTQSDINLSDCKHGVDRPKLHECLDKIHAEDCGNPIDTLSRVAACRTGALCIGG